MSKYNPYIVSGQSYAFGLKDLTHGGVGWALLIFAWNSCIIDYRASHIMSIIFAFLSFPNGAIYNPYFAYKKYTFDKRRTLNNEVSSLIIVVLLFIFGLSTTIYDWYKEWDYIMIYNLYSSLECIIVKIPIFSWYIINIDNIDFPFNLPV